MKRIYELDLLRGIAIVLMVLYHTMFDLQFFYNIETYSMTPLAKTFVYFIAGMFMLISGASAVLGKHTLKRGLITFGMGCIITIVTYLINKETYVTFGILSLLGVCMVVAHFLKTFNVPVLQIAVSALIIAVLGVYFSSIKVINPNLFWMGLITSEYQSLDHYPIFPWLGVFLTGVCFGKTNYANGSSPFTNEKYNASIFTWVGRHSFVIYLLHQPVVMGLIWVIFKLT